MSMDQMDHARLNEQLRREQLTECAECGWEFHEGKLLRRRAKDMDVCVSCAIDLGLEHELHEDDLADLAERASGAGGESDGPYYSSERMDAARRIGQ